MALASPIFHGEGNGRLSAWCTVFASFSQVLDGRLVFLSDATKGRKERKALLPTSVYQELQELRPGLPLGAVH